MKTASSKTPEALSNEDMRGRAGNCPALLFCMAAAAWHKARMIRHAITAAALLAAAPLAAQSVTQEQIVTRYDRSLAAGYKALFL